MTKQFSWRQGDPNLVSNFEVLAVSLFHAMNSKNATVTSPTDESPFIKEIVKGEER